MAKKRPLLWFEEPFDDFRKMQEDFLGSRRKMLKPAIPRLELPDFESRFIPIRIGETDREIVLRSELPELSKDEIKLKVTPKTLFISTEKRGQSIERDERSFRMQKGFNSSSRFVTLPEEVRVENVKARFENGVLEVVMQKKENRKKDVEIE